jgi:hypothetical protein
MMTSDLRKFAGQEAILEYAESLRVKIESNKAASLLRSGRKRIQVYVSKTQKGKCLEDAVDLMEKMMTADHRKRIAAAEALKHPSLVT